MGEQRHLVHWKYAPVSCNEGGKVGWAEADETVLHSVARRRRRRRAEGTWGGCGWVGQDRRHGGRRPTSQLWDLQYTASRVETSPQSGSCLKQCCSSSKAVRAAKIASFSLQPAVFPPHLALPLRLHHHNQPLSSFSARPLGHDIYRFILSDFLL